MKRSICVTVLLLGVLLLLETAAWADSRKLPVIGGKATVATVNDEPITLEEFNRAIAASHAARSAKNKAGRIDYSAIMKRMINTRLIVLEARNMGLDELPEIRKMVDAFSKETLIELLIMQHVENITADENEIKTVYQDMVKEWQLTSVRFERLAAAKKFEEQIKAGSSFDQMVEKAAHEGRAKEVEAHKYLKDRDLTGPVAQLVAKMEVGSVSPIVSVGKKGFIIFKLEGIRFPENEDSEAWKKAERQAINQSKVEAARKYYGDLKKRYAKVDEQLFETLDYESEEPGFEKLLQDKRIIAEIKGQKPITVGYFSQAVKKKFYHGVKLAAESKRVNKRKMAILEDMLQRRIFLKEALRLDIDKTEEYVSRVKEYEYSVIFGVFIKKVVTPDIKLDIQELKTYYTENAEEFTSPQMMRIKSLVFRKRDDAVAAIDKLKKGTDFNWLSSNADGQVDENAKGLINFGGKLLTLKGLPADVQKALSRAKPGDFKLYESPQGHFYVLYTYQIVAPEARPFESVRKEIAEEVFNQKVKEAVDHWTDQLNKYYPVTIYRADLRR